MGRDDAERVRDPKDFLSVLSSSSMRARDTSEKAAAVQDRLHEAIGPEGRFLLAIRLSALAREFAIAGVRERHPEYTEAEVLRELGRELYDRSLP